MLLPRVAHRRARALATVLAIWREWCAVQRHLLQVSICQSHTPSLPRMITGWGALGSVLGRRTQAIRAKPLVRIVVFILSPPVDTDSYTVVMEPTRTSLTPQPMQCVGGSIGVPHLTAQAYQLHLTHGLAQHYLLFLRFSRL